MTDAPKRKRKHRLRTSILTVFTLIAVGLFTFSLANREQLTQTYNKNSIHYERYWRFAYHRFGYTLPGTPKLENLSSRLASNGHKLGDAIFMRIFKREFKLEIWLKRDKKFHRFATYPICMWSGKLGPKLKQGDKQAPEGVYTVSAKQLNPNSRWHRSFNLGFPNLYDRTHNRTGSFLMVHGGCSSAGCYAMTNDVIDEVWALVTAALKNGQKRFQVQSFPFRLTDTALAATAGHKHASLWRDLKTAHDLFEQTNIPPVAAVCADKYAFKAGPAGSSGSALIKKNCKNFKSVAGR